MRILIINTDYDPFLRNLYGENQNLTSSSYEEQLRDRNDTLFGVADFYSRNFIALGHQAWEIHANNAALQAAWLNSHGIKPIRTQRPAPGAHLLERITARITSRHRQRASPLRSPTEPFDLDLEQTLVAQARALRPDVILNQAVSEVQSHVLRKMRPYTGLIVGQIASPLPEEEDYSAYDLMISSLPNFIKFYRARKIPAELNRLGFEPTVFDQVGQIDRDVPLSFVGSITTAHKQRFDFLETLAAKTDIAIWGRISVPDKSPILQCYRGEAWGREMYKVLARSKITVNQHIDIAEGYANNMRLFEATGMGALLITDWKENIRDLFEPGKEVVCYHNAVECMMLIRYYLENEQEGAAIAAAGQCRTLKDHTLGNRVADLSRLFAKKLAASA
jgi:spore maturation protein CgeB